MKQSIENIDISIVPFSRRQSKLMILMGAVEREGDSDDGLFMAFSANIPGYIVRYDLIRIIPTVDGRPASFTYIATPGILKLYVEGRLIELCFDSREIVRFRASGGAGLRFHIRFDKHEQFMDRYDGTVYAGFNDALGEYLFEATHGYQSHNGRWDAPGMSPTDTDVDWAPSGDGCLEGYIKYAEYSVNKPRELRDFDECVSENFADFHDWCRHYDEVPTIFFDSRMLSIYVIWICLSAQKGHMNDNMVFMMRSGLLIRAMGWQQSYQAMACWKNLDFAIGLIYSMFTLQDELGQLPDGANDTTKFMLTPKPPFQGFALSYIIDKVGIDALTIEHCKLLYEPICKWINWWITYRDRDGDGLVSYIHGDESGWDDSSIFSKGIPVATPDIAAFLVLCMEVCGKLASRLGFQTEAESWNERSKQMLVKMIETFWNGEKFVCILDTTHEIVDVESIAMYQPIILGKRLPQYIIDKLADALSDTERFLTPYGYVSESMKSELYDVTSGSFMLGLMLAPVQCMVIIGLYNAGKTELACRVASAWCGEAGPQTILRKAPIIGTPKPEVSNPITPLKMPPAGLSSWGAAIFLILASLLNDA